MPFTPQHLSRFSRGAVLVGESDAIPDDALRRAVNVRLDRTLGAIEGRPGWSARTATAFASSVLFLSKLVGRLVTYGYVQIGTLIQRTADNWTALAVIATPGSTIVSDANSPDGAGHPHKYFVNESVAVKDDGSTTTTMGIAPPGAAPLSTAVATDLFTQIDRLDDASLWTGANLSAGPTTDANIWQLIYTNATATIGSGTNGTVTTTIVNPTGIGGNAYTIEVVVAGAPNAALAAAVVGTAITVTLGTDGGGAPDPTKNTATLVAAAISALAPSEAVVSGTGASPLTGAEGPHTFAGGLDGASVRFTVAPSTFGSIGLHNASNINLDTLTNGDNLVKDDDYIHLWVRIDHPERITFMQLDIDVDPITSGLADAFRHNYYSVRVASLTRLSQGSDQWTKVQIRKSEFQRYGTGFPSIGWESARTFRIGFQTNSLGSAIIYVDDYKLRGGVGIEGDITYTVCYQNSSTHGRGNPPKDADGVVLYTAPLTVDRQRVNVDISNVRQGGINHPGDTQIDRLMIWRKGGIFTTAVLVDTINDVNASPYLDHTSDATLILTNKLLETDNDMPPTGQTRVLFGPDATGHFFMIVDGYRLYISKPYEDKENRVENWPALGFGVVSDSSGRAIAGCAVGTEVTVWTSVLTYDILGVGQDLALPNKIDGSRGIVGEKAWAAGDNAKFFVSQDGIYEMRGRQQQKLTGAIDPFFEGLTVDEQIGFSTDPLRRAETKLAFLHQPSGSMLVMLYAEAGAATTNRMLVMKPNPQTGRLTEAFFDYSNLTEIRSLFLDEVRLELLAGAANGHVYRLEDPTTYTDSGTGFFFAAQSKSSDSGQPQRPKRVAQAAIEGSSSGQSLNVDLIHDRGAILEPVGLFQTLTEVSIEQLAASNSLLQRHDTAVRVSGTISARLVITRLGLFTEALPEATTFRDSGELSFDFTQLCKRFLVDIDAPVDTAVTLYGDGSPLFTGILNATTERRALHWALPAGMQGRVFRVTLRAETAFLLYKLDGLFKPLGIDQDYQTRTMVQGV